MLSLHTEECRYTPVGCKLRWSSLSARYVVLQRQAHEPLCPWQYTHRVSRPSLRRLVCRNWFRGCPAQWEYDVVNTEKAYAERDVHEDVECRWPPLPRL